MLESLLGGDDAAFFDELDQVTEPAALRRLARSWIADGRERPRRLLLDYLSRPLHPFHEPIVVELLRQAQRQNDDQVMGLFLVLFDTSLRRHLSEDGSRWRLRAHPPARGIRIGNVYILRRGGRTRVLRLPAQARRAHDAYRVFAVATRLLLRRRVWRWFHRLGRDHPQRYVPAAVAALRQYSDEDLPQEVTFLDNWGLLHLLFHHSQALRAARGGWLWAQPWQSWQEVLPAPAHEPLWQAQPEALLGLLRDAPCQLVRTWAARLLRRQAPEVLQRLPADALFNLLRHPREETVCHAVDVIRSRGGGLEGMPVDSWLSLATQSQEALPAVLNLWSCYVAPSAVPKELAVTLACSPSPEVRDYAWREYCMPRLERGELDARTMLRILPRTHGWPRHSLVQLLHRDHGQLTPDDLLRLLEHDDPQIRHLGRTWGAADLERCEVGWWRRLAGSPYPDVRDWLLGWLESYQQGKPLVLRDALDLTPDELRVLWARALLTVAGPWVRQAGDLARLLVARLRWRSGEAGQLLPMLAVLLRHTTGPAWREALAGVVGLVEEHPGWQEVLARELPELRLPDLAEGPGASLP